MPVPNILDEHLTTDQLQVRITEVGEELLRGMENLIRAVNAASAGPQQLARDLGVDTVLASRLMKMIRSQDPLAAAYLAPGPDPLRRVLKGAARAGAPGEAVLRARIAVDDFETMVRVEAGDRSGLDAMLSAWLPDVRAEFELRRKQAAFRAISQLKGVSADVDFATVVVNRSQGEPDRLDLVWLFGIIGLQRLRADAPITISTRRLSPDTHNRQPVTLDGRPVEEFSGLRLEKYCSQPPPEIRVLHSRDIVRYQLAGDRFGPSSAVDLVFAEVNRSELDRRAVENGRVFHAFAEVVTPAKKLLFTVLVQNDVYSGLEPSLRIYDTTFEGVADPNDSSRDARQWDIHERLDSLGVGLNRFGASEVPHFRNMLSELFTALNWDGDSFRGYRCRIEYPIYGSQVTVCFG